MTSRVNREIYIHASFALLAVISIAFPIERANAATAGHKVRMSFAAISGAVAPIWIAKDLGFFEKNGLDVDPGVDSKRSSGRFRALLSGEMPIINTGANSAIAANLGGTKEPVVIATFYNTLVFSLVGKPDITNITGLKGKVLGVTQLGSLSDFTARLVLALGRPRSTARCHLTPNRRLQRDGGLHV